MFAYILWNLLLSILVIATAHSLWNYWNENYSPKRAKDLVGYQTKKYKDMMQELISTNQSQKESSSTINKKVYLCEDDRARMIADLQTLVTSPPPQS